MKSGLFASVNIRIRQLALRAVKYLKISDRRVCSAAKLSRQPGFHGFSEYHHHEPIKVSEPSFYVREPLQTSQLKHYLENPNLKSHTAGIVSASNVSLVFPSAVHRWNGKVFAEGLTAGRVTMDSLKLALDVEAVPFSGKKSLSESVLLALPWYYNYYHWMIEMLPRLRFIDQDPQLRDLPLLVPGCKTPQFIADSLKLTHYIDRVAFIDDGVYSVDKLHIPSLVSNPSHPSPVSIAWLREKFLVGRHVEQSSANKRIYISRKDAAIRHISNEAEVEEVLARLGFKAYCMTDYSLTEQIDIFMGAEIVVGAHGAALTNLVFAPPGAACLEMFLEGWFNNAYYHICQILQLKYGFLVCVADGKHQYIDTAKLQLLVSEVIRDRGGMPSA